MSTDASNTVERLEGRTLLALAAGFENVRVLRVDGTESPQLTTSMEFSPDGRIFVTDRQDGQVEVIKQDRSTGQWRKNPTPALTLAIDRFRERGLQSLAFDPDYESNRYLYVYYSTADPANPNAENNGSRNRLVRYQTRADNPDLIDPASATVLIDDIPTPTGIHNGGAMHFGADGMLYLAIGEGGISANAQDLSNLNGKVLRLDTGAFNGSGNPADLVPADNPFAGQAGRRGEIWAYGLRNPFTGAIQPGTNTLFINDVGGTQWEEVNQITRGGNFGWPRSEGASSDPAHVDPVHAYTHFPNGTGSTRVQSAVTGGVFYNGTQFPEEYRGKYFFADYLRKWVKVLDPATGRVTTFGDALTGFLDLDVAPDGSLWGLEIGGNLYRFRYVGQANRPPTAAASADRTSGAIPLTVSFSGAASSDPDGDALTYAWDFGDGQSATGRDVTHAYETAGSFTARLRVSDGRGGTDDSDPVTITAGSSAPSATIGTPGSGTLYRGGETISYSGTGTDAEDGDLPAGAFSWRIVFHHDDHTHPFLGPIDGVTDGSFDIPTGGELDPDQWYRIHLTVTDSDGLTTTVTRDVRPRTSRVTLATNVDGLSLRLDGATVAEGSSFVGVEGMVRSIGAPATQTLNGRTYEFLSWSDGNGATHDIATPTDDTTYTATYREVTGGSTVVVRANADAYVRNGTYAGTNFGSATQIQLKKGSTGVDRRGYLRFDIGAVSASTASVKLRLFGNLHSTENASVPVALYPVSNTTWSETGLTYNNRPVPGTTALATASIVGTTRRWYELDVTGYVKAQKAAGASAVSFALLATSSTASIAQFNADESSSSRPELVVSGISQTGGGALDAAAAAHVVGGASAATNYGSSRELVVKRSDAAPALAREAYLKFDLAGVTAISSARLRLFGRLNSTENASLVTNVYSSSNTSWTESGLTWNNKPAAGTNVLGSVTVSGTTGAWYEIDLTQFLRAEKAAGRNVVTLVLKNAANSKSKTMFNSDEAASNRPQLVVR